MQENLEVVAVTSTPEDSFQESSALETILLSQKHLDQIKTSLGAIIDTMQENESFFSRAANFWGKLPLWQKIIGGVVMSVPTLAAGIAAHLSALLVISGVTVLGYTASSIVLDDHHSNIQNFADRLKEGIFKLADILQITINALDRVRENLAKEIEKFRQQNLAFQKNITNLHTEVEMLTDQVDLLSDTEKLLRASKDELERTTANLKSTLKNNEKLLKTYEQELTQIRKEYAQNQLQLSEKVHELNEVRHTLNQEVKKAKVLIDTLQGTVSSLVNSHLEDETHRQAFQNRLKNFLCDEQASFASIADRICKAEEELVLVKEELKQSNERYSLLLSWQEQQVTRLEKIQMRPVPSPETDRQSCLTQVGLYAVKKNEKTHSIAQDNEAISSVPVH